MLNFTGYADRVSAWGRECRVLIEICVELGRFKWFGCDDSTDRIKGVFSISAFDSMNT